jgi:hypothetical protein
MLQVDGIDENDRVVHLRQAAEQPRMTPPHVTHQNGDRLRQRPRRNSLHDARYDGSGDVDFFHLMTFGLSKPQ